MTICVRHGWYDNAGDAPRDCPQCQELDCPSCASKDAELKTLREENNLLVAERRVMAGSLDRLRARLALLEKVAEAANKLIEHAMLAGCDCQGCVNMRAALRALPPPLQRGEERRREE